VLFNKRKPQPSTLAVQCVLRQRAAAGACCCSRPVLFKACLCLAGLACCFQHFLERWLSMNVC
jgi:hypothetical protein